MAQKYGVICAAASLTPYLDDFNELCSTWLCYHSVFADQLRDKFVEGGKEVGAQERAEFEMSLLSLSGNVQKNQMGFKPFSIPLKRVNTTGIPAQ